MYDKFLNKKNMCVQHRAWSQKTLEGGNTSLYTVIFAPPK